MATGFNCPECGERNTVGPEFAGRHGTCAFCGARAIVPESPGIATAVAQPPAPMGKSSTFWIGILVLACICFPSCIVMVALLLNTAREAARRAQCMNAGKQLNFALLNYQTSISNLKRIDRALLSYQTKYGRFPPCSGGTNGQLVSWRVAILPFLCGDYLQYEQNEPWNSTKNLPLVKSMPPVYHCPSDSTAGEGETSYVMITGENTIGGTPGSTGVSLSQIQGDRSKTIVVLEVHGLKIPWTEPRDITLDELLQRLRSSGGQIGHVSGFNVGMADGSVRELSYQTGAETLRALATINANKPVHIGSD